MTVKRDALSLSVACRHIGVPSARVEGGGAARQPLHRACSHHTDQPFFWTSQLLPSAAALFKNVEPLTEKAAVICASSHTGRILTSIRSSIFSDRRRGEAVQRARESLDVAST